jgi:hypothetical protein
MTPETLESARGSRIGLTSRQRLRFEYGWHDVSLLMSILEEGLQMLGTKESGFGQ